MRWLLVLVLACEREPVEVQPTAPIDARPVLDASVVFDAAPTNTCTGDHQCPGPRDGFTGCQTDCAIRRGESSGFCHVELVVTTEGQPCVGNRRGIRTEGSFKTTPDAPTIYFCDVDAGVYCDAGTKRCTAVKSLGAGCSRHDECGAGGVCDDETCVAAPRAGQPNAGGHCDRTAYSDDDGMCRARRRNGIPCTSSEECTSHMCMDGRCAPRKPSRCEGTIWRE